MNFDELVDKLAEYEEDFDHYETTDNFGNVLTDEQSLKDLKEYISKSLSEDPAIVLNALQENLEDIDDENDEMYKKTKELIDEIKQYQELNNDMEM